MKKRNFKSYFSKRRGDKMKCRNYCKGPCGGIYFLGLIGSVVYYIQQATSFGEGVIGVLKALVWPAFLVYKLLG